MPASGTNLRIPAAPLRVLTLLEEAGYDSYAVGGCVRDSLLGRTPGDWDLCTGARPEQVSQVLQQHGIRVIETGLQHGTVTAVIEHQPIEITTFRLDGDYTDHRRPDEVIFTDDLTADLSRRDFTVNAMAYHPARGLMDPFQGAKDLQAGLLRCVGKAARRFEEDALRILRCLRFASVLGFAIEEETAQALLNLKHSLAHVAAERIQKELTALLCGQNARQILMAYREVIFVILPQLQPMDGFDQRSPWHCYDVWEHSCAAAEAVPPDPVLRWAALLHDCGKPPCFFMRDGTGHFHGHADVSARTAQEIFAQLKFSKRMSDQALTLIAHHELRLLEQQHLAPARLRRLLGRYGNDTLLQLLDLARADVLAQAPEKRSRLEHYAPLRMEILALADKNTCVTRAQLAVNGSDLLPLGLQGPQLGRALDLLLEEVLEGRLPNEAQALLDWAVQNVTSFS